MALVRGLKASLTLRYWQASLAWKNIGTWAKGWTQESFIRELRDLCNDNGRVGSNADSLLDDMIHDRERKELPVAGRVVPLHSKTQIMGRKTETTIFDEASNWPVDNVGAVQRSG